MGAFKLTRYQKTELYEFAERWKVVRMELFGSAVRDDFDADSDIDLLLSFADECRWSLLDQSQMQEELEVLFGRNVDVLTRRSIENGRNPIRRRGILSSARPLIVAPTP